MKKVRLSALFGEGKKMNGTTKFLARVLVLGTALFTGVAGAAEKNDEELLGEVLFKIHDIVPEKDADGKVLYCNIGATFFNNTTVDLNNIALTLGWNDEVIGETIDQEERAAKEQQRTNSRAARSRYSTSGFTSKTIRLSLKLPPMKAKQQVSLKTKVDTDRCFLLLNDMDVNVNNCGTASMSGKVSRRGCGNLFRYVSPAGAEYYTEFKEISPDQQAAIEDAALDAEQKELEQIYNETLTAIQNIASDASSEAASGTKPGV